ncbi:MAG: hypothetical protein V3U86_12330 [Acidobacteriota bacterium]
MQKKTLAVLCAVVLVSVAGLALAGEHAEKGDAVSVQGWITDEACGKKNANAEGKACALACAKKGSALVLYSPSDDKTYGLDDQEQAKSQVGHEVKVIGTIDAESQKIKVTKIEAAGDSDKS